jgi:hypothetical protein
MTVSTSGYTVGTNYSLNNARILWDVVAGTATGDGTGPALAANDYTFQRWVPGAGAVSWVLTLATAADVDCMFIAAHNLSGVEVTISTSPDLVTAYTSRVVVTPADNSAIAALFSDGSGDAISAQRIMVSLDDGTGVAVGVIRAGVALQMASPFYSGHTPTTLARKTEAQQQFSESGQWLGRQIKRRAIIGSYGWTHLPRDWYAANFEPFALTLPLYPFGIAGNPAKMTDDVAWCWVKDDPKPSLMGVKNLMKVDLDVTGYW